MVLAAIYFSFLTIYFCLQTCSSLSTRKPKSSLPLA